MFKLIQVGSERSDCTAPFFVELDREYTVAEFIHNVLVNRSLYVYKEWGYIGIDDHGKTVFGSPRCEYHHGKLLTSLPADLLDKKVMSVKADGGWGSMNYLINLEDNPGLG